MRIGIVINKAWNIYNFRKCLVVAFQKMGHEVVAIANKDEFSEKLQEEWNCEFHHINMRIKGINPFLDTLLMLNLLYLYKKTNIDVVLHFTIKPNIYGSLVAKVLSIPIINNVSGLGTVFLRRTLYTRLALKLYKLSFAFPKIVFFQNPDDRSVFLSNKLVFGPKTRLLPGSGIDIEHFYYERYKRKEPFVFLMVGRALFDKGIMEYLEAARTLKKRNLNVVCAFLGSFESAMNLGIPKKEFDHYVADGIIEYWGKVSDVRPYLVKADCVVLPSYREGVPRSLIEAASMGRTLIATEVPGCKEIVLNNYNGLTCEAKNSIDLAQKMYQMYASSEEQLQVYSKNSRKLIVERFDEQFVVRKYEEAIDFSCPNTYYKYYANSK